MTRNLDELGRIVIPKEMRKELNIEGGDPINIELQNNKVIITKPDTVDYKERVDKVLSLLEHFDSGQICEHTTELSIEIENILNGKKD